MNGTDTSSAAFRVQSPGLMSTLQDLGRYLHLRLGISPCGAMDPLALRLANRLVGNPEGATCLEITLPGLELETLRDCQIAITGADLSAELDGGALALWRSHVVRPRQRLRFQKRIRGMRSYLAVQCGFQADAVLGSGSTDLRNGWGGLGGRALRKGDDLHQQVQHPGSPNHINRAVNPQVLREYQRPFLLRALPGPQNRHCSREAMERFFTAEFAIHPNSNRMGYALEGPSILASPIEIISDPVPLGAIQVLPNGQLVLMMADRQTVGGYPKIAVVISADLPKAAQLCPGHRIQFQTATLEEAHEALLKQEEAIVKGIIEC